MKKKYLLNKYPLMADARMIKEAGQDIPKQEKMYRTVKETYKNDIHINCQIKEGILMVGFYYTRDLRLGAPHPAFLLLIDQENITYSTWDIPAECWRSASVRNLPWQGGFYGKKFAVDDQSNQMLKDYLNVSKDGLDGILLYQESVMEKRLEKRHKKETDAWDKELAEIRPLPKDWTAWADRHGMHQHYLFYEYSRKKQQEGYCTWCRKMVPIKGKPKHNRIGRCCQCGHEIQYKARGKAGRFHTKVETAYILQPCGERIVLRQFKLQHWYYPREYENPECRYFEERRVLYDQSWNAEEYYFGDYKRREYRWIKGFRTYSWFCNSEDLFRDYRGEVYKRNLPALEKHPIGRTGLVSMCRYSDKVQPDVYLRRWKDHPYLEQVTKAGLYGLANSILERNTFKFTPSKELAKSLEIDRGRMRRLRENKGNHLYLAWLKYEDTIGSGIPDIMISWFQKQDISVDDLKFILDRMTPKRIYHYLSKQSLIAGRPPKELISTWQDYLTMAESLSLDTMEEIFFKPKDLKTSHNNMIAKLGGVDTAKWIQSIMRKYPDVDRICQSIKERYRFEDKRYRIVVPDGVRDIVVEGERLDLCTSWSEHYFSRIERQESYIVFLRKKEKPEEPFYLIEVEPGGSVRQERTTGDEQTPELADAEPFLKKWQQHILKNLTEEEKHLAQISVRLRNEEFKELRKKQSKIWNGSLRGQLLADVLEADLMEAVLCAEETENCSEDTLSVNRKAA